MENPYVHCILFLVFFIQSFSPSVLYSKTHLTVIKEIFYETKCNRNTYRRTFFAGCASTQKTTSFDVLTAELTESQKTDAAAKYYHTTPIAPNAELAAAPEQMVSPEDV